MVFGARSFVSAVGQQGMPDPLFTLVGSISIETGELWLLLGAGDSRAEPIFVVQGEAGGSPSRSWSRLRHVLAYPLGLQLMNELAILLP